MREAAPASTPEASQSHFLEILPRVETHARIHFRHLRCPGRRDDAVAETVAVAWKWFLRAAERGKDVAGFASAAGLAGRRRPLRPPAVRPGEGQGRDERLAQRSEGS